MASTRWLSEEGQRLVERLHRPRSRTAAAARDDRLDTLTALRELHEPAAVPHVFPLVADSSAAVATAAGDVAADLFRSLPPSALPWLDERMRDRGPRYRWRDVDLAACERHGEAETLIALASLHPDGRVREVAVQHLAASTSGSELPLLLLRRNDWVRQVRERAEAALDERIEPRWAPAWADNLTLVVRLRECGRTRHGSFVDRVFSLLRSPECQPTLLALLHSADRSARREACRLVLQGDAQAVLAGLAAARDGDDPVNRLWLSRAAVELVPRAELDELLTTMARDSFAPLRVLAVEARLEHLPEGVREHVAAGLFDRAGSVRERCQYHARRWPELDPAERYRRALEGAGEGIALLGLAETGDRNDGPAFLSRMDDERSRVRAAATRGLAFHGTREHVERLWSSVTDPSAKVRRHACAGLQRLSAPVLEDRLEALLTHRREGVRRTALSLIRRLPRTGQLLVLLRACATWDGELPEYAKQEIHRWLLRHNRGQVQFTLEQRDQALGLLTECRGRLPPRMSSDIGFLLETSKP